MSTTKILLGAFSIIIFSCTKNKNSELGKYNKLVVTRDSLQFNDSVGYDKKTWTKSLRAMIQKTDTGYHLYAECIGFTTYPKVQLRIDAYDINDTGYYSTISLSDYQEGNSTVIYHSTVNRYDGYVHVSKHVDNEVYFEFKFNVASSINSFKITGNIINQVNPY